MKWIPLNVDGTEHWDTCKRQQRAHMTTAEIIAECEQILPIFWTIPDGRGSFRTVRKKPANFGKQPAGELF